jgi:pyruvate dehydrogenase E1 component alpha subunit
MRAVYIHTEGPMGNLDWQYGDAEAWAPADLALDAEAGDILAELGKEKLADMYWKMFANYRWETAIKDINLEGVEAIGRGHLYIGEEAIAVGVMACLENDDLIASTHRGHGHLIAKGGDLNAMMAEFFAKITGTNQGFGGSMHLTDMSKGILGMNGIVGAGWYMAAGAAYAQMVKGTNNVAVALAGEGASNNIWMFSAVRSAALYKCPAIFVIENNFQMIKVPSAAVGSPCKYSADQFVGLGIPVHVVDGNDVAQVYAVAKQAVERARAGEGPSVIEGLTYRWYDHSGFAGAEVGVDAAWGLPYRSDEEVRTWMARAPWLRYRDFLTTRGIMTDAEIDAVEADVQAAVDASVEFAKAGEYPPADWGLKYVYAEGSVAPRQFIDGIVPPEYEVSRAVFEASVAAYEGDPELWVA